MNSSHPTPHQILRHKKGWRLVHVHQELLKRGTPVSYPTLLMIDKGFRPVNVRDENKKIISRKKKKYKPSRYTLILLSKLYKVKPEEIYSDRTIQ